MSLDFEVIETNLHVSVFSSSNHTINQNIRKMTRVSQVTAVILFSIKILAIDSIILNENKVMKERNFGKYMDIQFLVKVLMLNVRDQIDDS